MSSALPSPFEQASYYHGVGGILLARTSTFDFSKAEIGNNYTLGTVRFTNIGEHPIVSLWSPDVVRSLQVALQDVHWERIFPIRTKVVWPYEYDRLNKWRSCVVLIVEVPRGSLDHQKAATAAARCRTVLRDFRIEDVEVEIREINRNFCAMDGELESKIKARNWLMPNVELVQRRISYDAFSPALSDIGYQITPEFEVPTRSGTMGLHVRLTDRPGKAYGLTCRHVVHRAEDGFDEASKEAFWIRDKDGYDVGKDDPRDKHRILQMCASNLAELRIKIKGNLKAAERELQKLSLTATKHLCDPDSHLAPTEVDSTIKGNLETVVPFLQDVNDVLSSDRLDEADRIAIGHVATMAPLRASNNGFLQDWALVELDEAKFKDSGITNEVFIGRADTQSLVLDRDELHEALQDMENFAESRNQKGFVRLAGVSEVASRKTAVVGKRGAASQLTFGFTNEIMAVVQVDYGQRSVGWQYIIIGLEDSVPFSKPGDSGSVVFDSKGSVIAIITAGYNDNNEARRLWKKYYAGETLPNDPGKNTDQQTPDFQSFKPNTDLTFATPIGLVFDNIKTFTKSDVEII